MEETLIALTYRLTKLPAISLNTFTRRSLHEMEDTALWGPRRTPPAITPGGSGGFPDASQRLPGPSPSVSGTSMVTGVIEHHWEPRNTSKQPQIASKLLFFRSWGMVQRERPEQKDSL